MSVTKLPSGKWRSQVHVPGRGNVNVGTFDTKREARKAREDARGRLTGGPDNRVTVAEFRDRWITDPVFARPKQSTMVHNAERTRAFAARYGRLPLRAVDDHIVAEWLAGGGRSGTVPALRAMFTDAGSAKAGRLVDRNPFAKLGISKGRGNADQTPPSEADVWGLIRAAREKTCPSFAAWLQVACFTGIRPGELDALQWTALDLEGGRLRVAEQFSATTRTFTAPKNGKGRWAPLTPPAREALLSLPREGDYCFRPPVRGEHYSASSRAYHWKAVRAATDWDGTLYVASRHFAGWYMVNVLDLDSEDVAIALGHEDGGELVRRLYGHRDRDRALERVRQAYERVGNVKPLRVVREDTA